MEFGTPKTRPELGGASIDADEATGGFFRWNLVREYDLHS
jgi:hypothetical protein